MNYIKTSNGTVTLSTNKGTYILDPQSSFHYRKILKLLEQGTTEEELQEWLDPVDCPNGIYKLHEVKDSHFYSHVSNEGEITVHPLPSFENMSLAEPEPSTVIGIYPSLDDLIYDYPELFL